MTEYEVHGEEIKIANRKTGAKRLRLLHNGTQIASVDFMGNWISYIEGNTDRSFTRIHGRTPAMELLVHVAQHNRRADGTAMLTFSKPQSAMPNLIARLKRQGLIEEQGKGFLVKRIEPKISTAEIT